MRDHGVDMPDPDFSGGGFAIRVNGGTDTGGRGPKEDPAFAAAEAACSSLLPGKLGTGGPGGGGTDSKGGPGSDPAVNQ
jgi:hypothetical protein